MLRDDFRPDSDIDVLVTFDAEQRWTLFDWVHMQDKLSSLFNRKVDLVDKEGLKNPYRRHDILKTHRILHDILKTHRILYEQQ